MSSFEANDDRNVEAPATVDASEFLEGNFEARAFRNVSLDERVPDIGYNVLYRQRQVMKPVVDHQYLANGGRKPEWPNDADFAVCLTHDVDEVSKYSVRQFARKSTTLARLRDSPMGKARLLLKQAGHFLPLCYKAWQKPDPYHAYEKWLEVEEAVGARSTFFFMPETNSEPHVTDPKYEFSDEVVFDGQRCTVSEMMREIDRRGWEVGLHPTWHAYDDPVQLDRQKRQIEQALGHEVRSVRQHNLHYDNEVTPRAQSEAGLEFDSTLGFNKGVGFRFGTSYPWQLYDRVRERRLSILEIPLIAQDGALLHPSNGLSLDEKTALEYLVQLTEEVQAVGGVLTLNWHPRKISRPAWWNVYKEALKYLETKDVWFASLAEIGDWWLKNGFNIFR